MVLELMLLVHEGLTREVAETGVRLSRSSLLMGISLKQEDLLDCALNWSGRL